MEDTLLWPLTFITPWRCGRGRGILSESPEGTIVRKGLSPRSRRHAARCPRSLLTWTRSGNLRGSQDPRSTADLERVAIDCDGHGSIHTRTPGRVLARK